MLAIRPVEKSSRQTTSSPRDKSSRQRCEPMKPAPPVTKVRRRIIFVSCSFHCRGGRVTHGVFDASSAPHASWETELVRFPGRLIATAVPGVSVDPTGQHLTLD